jgi:polysaccharide export outer membrane protein
MRKAGEMAVRTTLNHIVTVLALTGLAVTSPAMAQVAPVAPAAAGTDPDAYVLGVNDTIEVSVVGGKEGPMRVQIQTDGTIQLPLIGTLTAAKKPVLALRNEIRSLLSSKGYYTNPAVNVTVVTFSSQYVTVLGEVGVPGLLPIDRAYRISEILAKAGSVKSSGSDTVTLTRANGQELKLPVEQLATGGPEQDPLVQPGDKVYVPMAKTFYIYGQVTRPGDYRADAGVNLRKALAVAGGLTALGSEKRIKVIRNGVEIKKFPLNDPIRAEDVVVVGERFF